MDDEIQRRHQEFLASLDEASASVRRGEGRIITRQSMRQLAAEVKERGRARLLAEQTQR